MPAKKTAAVLSTRRHGTGQTNRRERHKVPQDQPQPGLFAPPPPITPRTGGAIVRRKPFQPPPVPRPAAANQEDHVLPLK
eukprot:6205168-Prymnesium_polylepis.1